jgi:hypothetical protein
MPMPLNIQVAGPQESIDLILVYTFFNSELRLDNAPPDAAGYRNTRIGPAFSVLRGRRARLMD